MLNGITAEGCATFQGAGMSQGYWVLEGGSVSFEPLAEPLDLIIKLSEASAVPRATGLALTIDGTHHLLARSDAQGEQPDR